MYQAPIRDLRFVLDELLGVASLAALPRYHEFSSELAASVIDAAARFSQDVLAPINRIGDGVGARFHDGAVQMPEQFRSAYRQFTDGGWTQLAAAPEFGGQGAPLVLAVAVEEIGFGANIAFMLCPLLARGAAEALETAASAQLQAQLLPKIVSGEWTGTMNLTEPQAGSDLAAIRARAAPDGEHYRISGQKIFITYGEHDLAPNIVHLVLARIDGAAPGIKGISLFAVPKYLINADGSLGKHNDLRCVSIEHKLGIHASPTCVMSYGDRGGAVGYLIGEPHHGLEYMFIMMNSARLSVGVQGVGLAELALQQASDWARSRIQGRPAGGDGKAAMSIGHHPDVRRMLLTMKANVEAMRALALYAALQLDRARAEADEARRAAALMRGELLIPIVKGWCTDQASELASLAVQVHGGMGFIEETGAAQLYRDSRIAAIYEGTNGIQAIDLVTRKITQGGGAVLKRLVAGYRDTADHVAALGDKTFGDTAKRLESTLTTLERASEHLLSVLPGNPGAALAGATPYLKLFGLAAGGAYLADVALAARDAAAKGDTDPLHPARIATARFFAENLAPAANGLADAVIDGGDSVLRAEAALVA
jgi:alkylation response protein AidB-like acyl-CoA dehydrogenase